MEFTTQQIASLLVCHTKRGGKSS